MNEMEIFGKDGSHPIPELDVCDIEAKLKSGGAELVVVIASPMADDLRSRKRLMRKLENYLGYIRSEPFAAQYGAAPPVSVIVRYHPDISEGILDLLNQCHGWVEDSGATLVLTPLVLKN